jgi:anti-sigma factor RsiW
MIGCPTVREDLVAYLDGELDDEVAEAVRAHLATCRSCESMSGGLRASYDMLLEDVVAPPPAGFADRTAAVAREVRPLVPAESAIVRALAPAPFVGLAIAASALLVAAIGGMQGRTVATAPVPTLVDGAPVPQDGQLDVEGPSESLGAATDVLRGAFARSDWEAEIEIIEDVLLQELLDAANL